MTAGDLLGSTVNAKPLSRGGGGPAPPPPAPTDGPVRQSRSGET
jgi:hypothetical protein